MSTIEDLFQARIVAINVGLRQFTDSLAEQAVEVIQVDWVPPAGGDEDMLKLLDMML